MAEAIPELAFLQSLGQETATPSNDAQQPVRAPSEESDEDYDPSNLITDTTTYDPQTAPGVDQISQAPSRTESRVSNNKPLPAAATKQPRMKGGFAVDDSSDEEGTPVARPPTTGMNGQINVAQVASQPVQNSLPQSSSSSTPLPNVSVISAAQDQGVTGVVSPTSATLTVPAPAVASSIDTGAAMAPSANISQPLPSPAKASAPAATPTSATASALPKARLPNDRVGILEDRIAEDPRGDLEAWKDLIDEHKRRNKIPEARAVYDRFFEVFPHAADKWVEYAQMESDADQFGALEQIFQRSLMSVLHVKLWSTYLDYVRRRNNLTTDTSGGARQIVSQTFDFVLQNVGLDKDSGHIWQDYINFIKSGPGTVGGTSWQDQQKMDQLRKAYQRAVVVPTHATNAIWNEYSTFETGLNKITGRKFLQEKSPAFVTARSSAVAMANFNRELKRNTLPVLPPAPGFEGDVEYMRQVELWKHWIQWEKSDPLVIKEEDPTTYKNRIVYVYKHALMALRFWPEIWYDAADFCFDNAIKDANGKEQGTIFLEQGIAANPESLLLAFKQADSIEISMANESGDDALKRRGDAVRAPYNKVLDALYALVKKTDARKNQDIARVKELAEQEADDEVDMMKDEDDDDDDQPNGHTSRRKEEVLKMRIDAIQYGAKAQVDLTKKLITSAWVALMRAMRRIQGKGKIGDPVGGSRQVFADARKRGWITSEVYIASALMEYHSYKDPAATKILEKGVKLYPEDEHFALEYLKHLIAINDVTNARAVFETTVNRLASKPETLDKAKPLYGFFHEYESQYGELSQVIKLEKRMADLWPSEPQIELFAHRFSAQTFDPTSARPIISPATQAKPKTHFMIPSIEKPSSATHSPRLAIAPLMQTNSPKRPFMQDESDNDALPPRKLARGESPLKGAAGRRLDANRRTRDGQPTPQMQVQSLPTGIMFMLQIIPGAKNYDIAKFSPERMVELLRGVDLSRADLTQPGRMF